MDNMFPCKQMDTTKEYRDKHEDTFGETDIFKNLADKRFHHSKTWDKALEIVGRISEVKGDVPFMGITEDNND